MIQGNTGKICEKLGQTETRTEMNLIEVNH